MYTLLIRRATASYGFSTGLSCRRPAGWRRRRKVRGRHSALDDATDCPFHSMDGRDFRAAPAIGVMSCTSPHAPWHDAAEANARAALRVDDIAAQASRRW